MGIFSSEWGKKLKEKIAAKNEKSGGGKKKGFIHKKGKTEKEMHGGKYKGKMYKDKMKKEN